MTGRTTDREKENRGEANNIYTQGITREQATGGTTTLIQAKERRENKSKIEHDIHKTGDYQSKKGNNTHKGQTQTSSGG